MNKSESKYFATAARMDEAFLELIEHKDLPYITVKEICERAGVNRSTFYLHYETVDDLLQETTQHIIDQFTDSMPYETSDFLKNLDVRPLKELYLVAPEYLTPYLTYIKEHRRIFRASIKHASVLQMTEVYQKLKDHILIPILNRFQVPEKEHKYLLRFYIYGLMAIISEWLEGECSDSTEYIVSLMIRYVNK